MIECVLISVGTVFGILGIIKLIEQIHRAIFIDRVPRWELESAKADTKRVEKWEEDWIKEINRLNIEIKTLKAKRK